MKHAALLLTAATVLMAGPQSPVSTVPVSSSPTSAPPSEPVNAGDVLSVFVANFPEISRNYEISRSGLISIPVFAEPLAIAGLTPAEVEKTIGQALQDARLLVKPLVSASVVEYRSRPVQISGAVKHPVTIQALGDMHLLDALAKSDGLDSNAGPEILVLRPGAATAAERELHIPVKALLEGSDPLLNVSLQGGEQIRVPQAGKLYIVGHVKAPGVFAFTEADGLSVLKAVGLCQGLLPFAQNEAIVYRLIPGSLERSEIVVRVNDILKHRAADVPLQPNDIFYVADNSGKRLTAGIIERITGVGSAASTVMLFRAVP